MTTLRKVKFLFTASTLAFTLVFTGAIHADKLITIDDAWIAEAPPTARVMVGYMTIKNSSTQAIDIIKASSSMYSSIEFHETVHREGMARMLRHDSLNIPANGSVQLKPGGKHLMLFNPEKALKAGDTVAITFITKDKTSMTIDVHVEKTKF
jgi:copper(I)-binding protein